MMEILLEVQHLTIAYPQNREVVRELNLCLKKGERLGIVGESGAGKTTLAMALAGINNQEQTRSGTVTFYGKQRGIILQNAMTCLDPLMKIKDQLKEVLCKSRKCSKKEAYKQAEELLEEVGIFPAKQYMESYPFMCSGGMQQRINLAMALAADPDLLIADEPTSALDLSVQSQILKLLKRVCRDRELALILVSHDRKAVSALCQRVCELKAGKLTERTGAEKPRRLRNTPNESHGEGEVLILKNLQKSYGRQNVLQDINLTINTGEIYGLAGESGCGKTTLAKVITALTKADAGEVQAERVQMIFQNAYRALNPAMTAEENLREALRAKYGRRKAKSPWADQKIREAFEMVEMKADRGMDRPAQFSGGQLQRLTLARALLLEPKLLICDEVFSGLDETTKEKMKVLLKNIRRDQNLSILFIGHDLETLEELSDRMGVMYGGYLVEEGNAGALKNDPWHPYTKKLFRLARGEQVGADSMTPEKEGKSDRVGCPYAGRCPYTTKRCEEECPGSYRQKDLYGERTIRCFLYETENCERESSDIWMHSRV